MNKASTIKKEKKSSNKVPPLQELQNKIQEFKINENQVRIIKILNFLNYHKKLLDLDEEKENSVNFLAEIVKLFTNPQSFSNLEKYNLFTFIFNKISLIIYSHDLLPVNEESDSYVLNNFIQEYKGENLLKKNWFYLMSKYLNEFNNLSQYDLSHFQDKMLTLLKELEKENFTQTEICLIDKHFHIYLRMLELMIELTFLTQIVKDHSKEIHLERNKNEMRKKKENDSNEPKIKNLDPEVIHKDYSLILYSEREKDFKALRTYLMNTIYLVKNRNKLIDLLKDFSCHNSESTFDLKNIKDEIESPKSNSYNEEVLLFKENDLDEIKSLRINFLQTFKFLTEEYKNINKCLHEEEYTEEFEKIIESKNDLDLIQIMRMVLILAKCLEFPMESSAKSIKKLNSVFYLIKSSEKDIISYYFVDDDSSNAIVNLLTEKRTINKTQFLGKNLGNKNFYNSHLKKITRLEASIGDIQLFLIFLTSVIGKYAKRKAKRNSHSVNNKKTYNNIYNEEEETFEETSVSFTRMTKNSRKIIQDDYELEEPTDLNIIKTNSSFK